MKSNGGVIDEVSESFCNENKATSPGVEIGSWVNTNADYMRLRFKFFVHDYEPRMAEFDERNKFEIHFKCEKDPTVTTPEPSPSTTSEITSATSSTKPTTKREPMDVEGCHVRGGDVCPLFVDENNGVTTISMVDNVDTHYVSYSRQFYCGYGKIVQSKIDSMSGLASPEDAKYCDVDNYLEIEYRESFKAFKVGLFFDQFKAFDSILN